MLNTATRATRATRPLFDAPTYFERTFCDDCMSIHMVELTRSRKAICHGSDYFFQAQAKRTHYSRRLGNGFELVPITSPAQMPLDWQMAAELQEPEYIDIDQDW